MKDSYNILNIPSKDGYIDFEKVIKELKTKLQELENKEELLESEQNDKNFINKILEIYDNYGEEKKEEILKIYVQYKYQETKKNSKNKTSDIAKALKDVRKKININPNNSFKDNLKSNTFDIKEKIQEFYIKHPKIKKPDEIRHTNFLNNYYCNWNMNEYSKREEILNYTNQNGENTKATLLGDLEVDFIYKMKKIIGKKPFNVINVEKTQNNGSYNSYTVLINIPYSIDKEETKRKYAEEVFSYAMLENSKKCNGYIPQIDKLLESKINEKDIDTIDGAMIEILEVVKNKTGSYTKITTISPISFDSAIQIINQEKSYEKRIEK